MLDSRSACISKRKEPDTGRSGRTLREQKRERARGLWIVNGYGNGFQVVAAAVETHKRLQVCKWINTFRCKLKQQEAKENSKRRTLNTLYNEVI